MNGKALFPAFSFAYQPIVDTEAGVVFAHEALVRGGGGQSAASVFRAVSPELLHEFDRQARMSAVELAVELGLSNRLSLNFLPKALETLPNAVESLIDVSATAGVPPHRIILE